MIDAVVSSHEFPFLFFSFFFFATTNSWVGLAGCHRDHMEWPAWLVAMASVAGDGCYHFFFFFFFMSWGRPIWLMRCSDGACWSRRDADKLQACRYLGRASGLVWLGSSLMFLFFFCHNLEFWHAICLQFYSLFAPIHQLCLPMRVANHWVHKFLCTCRVVPRCTRNDSWLICIVSPPRLTSKSGAPPMLLPYLMMCMSSYRRLRLKMCLVWIRTIQMPDLSHFVPPTSL